MTNFLERFYKNSYIKFHENPSSGSRVFPCGRKDRQNEANCRFSQRYEKRLRGTDGCVVHLQGFLFFLFCQDRFIEAQQPQTHL